MAGGGIFCADLPTPDDALSAEGWSTVEGEVTFYIPPHTAAAVGGPRFLMTGQIQKDPALLQQQQDQRVAVVVAVAWDT